MDSTEKGPATRSRPAGVKKKVIGIVLGLALLGGAGIAYSYQYQGARFIGTEDARVSADLIMVTPQVAGKLTAWNVNEGDRVEAGQVLGTIDPDLGGGAATGQPGMAAAPSMTPDAVAAAANRSNVRAPSSGMVIRSTAVTGAPVAPGQALAYLADPDQFYVVANIEETHIERVKPAQIVDIRLDAYPGVVLQGRVRSVGLATTSTFSLLPAQNASGSFTKVTQRIPVKIDLPASKGIKPMPGLNVTARIHVGTGGMATR